MIRALSSEWLRTKGTGIRWLIFGMPVFFSMCAVIYLITYTGVTQKFVFEGFFTIWTVFILPLDIGLLTGLVVHEEEQAGNFNGFLGMKISRTRLYLGKFLLLILFLIISVFLSTIVLCIGINLFMPIRCDWKIFLLATVYMMIGAIPLLFMHLWISFAWGVSASIGISVGGILIAGILGITSVGEKIWQFFTWTWPVKLCMLPGTFFLVESKEAMGSEILSSAERTVWVGLGAVVIGIIIFLSGGLIWFRIWEGRKNSE